MKKSQIKFYLLWFCEDLSVGLIPYAHHIATQQRGYEAFGSEYLLFLIPLLFYFVTKKDDRK